MEKGKADLATLLNDYNICLQNRKQDLLKSWYDNKTRFHYNVLQKSEHSSKAENKTLILVGTEIVIESKQAQHGTPSANHEEIATWVPVHLTCPAVQVDNDVLSRVEREGSKL